MDKSNKKTFFYIARQVSIACIIDMLYILFAFSEKAGSLFFPVALIIYSVLICLINFYVSKKEIIVSKLIIINAVCFAIMLVICLFQMRADEFWIKSFAFIAFIIITMLGAVSVFSGIKISSLIISFDGNIAMLIFSVLLFSFRQVSSAVTVFSIVGAIVALLGIISFRKGNSSEHRETAVIVFLLIAIFLIAWLLFAFVISPVSTGAIGVGRGIASFFALIGGGIERFVAYLASFRKEDGSEAVALSGGSGSLQGGSDAGGNADNNIMPIIIFAIIIISVIVAFILVLKRAGKRKMKMQNSTFGMYGNSPKKTPVNSAFKIIVEKIKRWINVKRFIPANRNKAEGIYFAIEKACRHTAFEKRPQDTPSDFLEHIRKLSDNEKIKMDLSILINGININFYSASPEDITYPWGGSLVNEIRKMSHDSKKK